MTTVAEKAPVVQKTSRFSMVKLEERIAPRQFNLVGRITVLQGVVSVGGSHNVFNTAFINF
jgi:hypothetical protein